MKTYAVALPLLAASAFILAFPFLGLPNRPTAGPPLVVDTTGSEAPEQGAVHENGWNVANYDAATIKDTYLRYQGLLGEPVSGFDGRCQSFRFGRLCYHPDNPDDWQAEFD